MDTTKAPPEIFDIALQNIRRARAARRAPSFLARRCGEDAAERLCDVNRRFQHALIIGPEAFAQSLLSGLPKDKYPENITQRDVENLPEAAIAENPRADTLPAKYDLIISGLRLHAISDLPGALILQRQQLSPDGLFIGAMFGGETLSELRRAAYAADEAVLGGLTPRVYPFADYSQAAALLQRSGFALPVIDTDRLTVRYKDLQRLFEDIRDLGDTNCLYGRNRALSSKAWRDVLLETYMREFHDAKKYKATFEILWLTGWAPHESQQKPLRPGSAKMRLADALGVNETPIKPV